MQVSDNERIIKARWGDYLIKKKNNKKIAQTLTEEPSTGVGNDLWNGRYMMIVEES